ncbi:MAG: RDD family protein [Acidimicrobiales bacterium]|nr:RDD family protein [Acidimicrobiales bacterium]
MSDLNYLPPPGPGQDHGADRTAVMGRRTVAWILDLVIYLGLAIALFAALAEYVEIPDSIPSLEACDQLQFQDGDAAAGCLEVGDRAYLTSNADNGIQTLASLGYFLFFIVLQGATGASPGKLLTGVRVVREDGSRPGFGRSLGRTLLWIVDGAPWFLPIVGFVVGLTSTGHRRVGDMAAKTYVVARRDAGQPVTVGSPVMPPTAAPWGAPPPPTGPPTAPPPAAPLRTNDELADLGVAPPPSVEDLAPRISGRPDEAPAPPPPLAGRPVDEPPTLDITGPEPERPVEAEQPPMPEIDGRVDYSPPEVDVDPDWWKGPEASPESAAPAPPPDEQTLPDWAAEYGPTEAEQPPTTPTEEMTTRYDASPTAGPTPFIAPGADPVTDAPTAPEPASLPPPRWDAARNSYIQWHTDDQQWLQWDDGAQRWKLIDT